MPKIPVNLDEMQTTLPDLDESIPYHGIVRKCALADEPDKNGHWYLTGVYIEVLDPEEFKGRVVGQNYMPIVQGKATGDFDIQFPRFVKTFKVPLDSDGDFDPSLAVGCEGDFTVMMDEYQGRKLPKVKDFLM